MHFSLIQTFTSVVTLSGSISVQGLFTGYINVADLSKRRNFQKYKTQAQKQFGSGLESMMVTVMKNKLHGVEVILLLLGKAGRFTNDSAVTGS